MSNTSALDIITAAFRKLGVFSTIDAIPAADANNGLDALNNLIDSWSNDKLLIPYRTQDQLLNQPAGLTALSIGPTGQIVTARPIYLESVSVTDTFGIIRYFDILTTEQTADLRVQGIAGSATVQRVAFDPQYPNANLLFYPSTQYGGTITVESYKPLTTFTTLNQPIVLPPGYKRMMIFNLAVEMAGEYGIEANQTVTAIAIQSLAEIKDLMAGNAMPIMVCDVAIAYPLHANGGPFLTNIN